VSTKTRQIFNFSNLFGSATSKPAYDRLASQPVFAVTTSWGSPYLLYERRDETESSLEFDDDTEPEEYNAVRGSGDRREGKTHQVALYFMDEDDAIRLRDEMLQMDQMKGADMRITAFSLSKAICQAKNLNKGLLTGQGIDKLSGKLSEGGVLRYKIVPPKRELYYAARCKGRERVGLFAALPEEDAQLMMNTMPVIGGTLAMMRKNAVEKQKRKLKLARRGMEIDDEEDDPLRKQYAHMEGFLGLPVFSSPELKKHNAVKSLLRNDGKMQTPLYFSYEDLMDSWTATRDKLQEEDKKNMSATPEDVEVFNVIDVITSMDRDSEKQRMVRSKTSLVKRAQNIVKRSVKASSGLEQIVFVPTSKSTKFKEDMTKNGNSQVRPLSPMRPWGRYG